MIAKPTREFATWITDPRRARPGDPLDPYVRGTIGGAAEGLASLLTPANVASTLLGAGAAGAAARGATGLSRLLRGADVALNIPLAAEGTSRTFEGLRDRDLREAGLGFSELAGAALGGTLAARSMTPRAPRAAPAAPVDRLTPSARPVFRETPLGAFEAEPTSISAGAPGPLPRPARTPFPPRRPSRGDLVELGEPPAPTPGPDIPLPARTPPPLRERGPLPRTRREIGDRLYETRAIRPERSLEDVYAGTPAPLTAGPRTSAEIVLQNWLRGVEARGGTYGQREALPPLPSTIEPLEVSPGLTPGAPQALPFPMSSRPTVRAPADVVEEFLAREGRLADEIELVYPENAGLKASGSSRFLKAMGRGESGALVERLRQRTRELGLGEALEGQGPGTGVEKRRRLEQLLLEPRARALMQEQLRREFPGGTIPVGVFRGTGAVGPETGIRSVSLDPTVARRFATFGDEPLSVLGARDVPIEAVVGPRSAMQRELLIDFDQLPPGFWRTLSRAPKPSKLPPPVDPATVAAAGAAPRARSALVQSPQELQAEARTALATRDPAEIVQELVDPTPPSMPRRYADLSADERAALEGIRVLLEETPYTPRTWRDTSQDVAREGGYGTGRGARGLATGRSYEDLPFVESGAGHPVFHEIMRGRRGTRQSVIDALRRYEAGQPPSAIVARALDVARSDPGKYALPPVARPPEVEPVAPGLTTTEPSTAGAGTKPFIPAPIIAAWNKLRPMWAETVAKQAGDEIPFVVDPTEDLIPFAQRVLTSDPKELMGIERTARESVAKRAIRDLVRGEDPEAGFVDPSALVSGARALGERVAPYLEPWRYASMLSGPITHAKNLAGNIGGAHLAALESLAEGEFGRSGRILREFWSPETARGVREAFNAPQDVEAGWGSTTGPMSTISRAMAAPDIATRGALMRAGVDPEVSRRFTFGGMPASQGGQAAMEFFGRWPLAKLAVPFPRIAINILERNVEHTPLLGSLAQAVSGGRLKTSFGKQAIGAGAMAAGASLGGVHPVLQALLAQVSLPYSAGAAYSEAREKGHDPITAARRAGEQFGEALPIPAPWELGPESILAQYAPNIFQQAGLTDPSEFEQPWPFGKAIAKIPGLNELLLQRKGAPRRRGRPLKPLTEVYR
jgi:hypothetical protein